MGVSTIVYVTSKIISFKDYDLTVLFHTDPTTAVGVQGSFCIILLCTSGPKYFSLKY